MILEANSELGQKVQQYRQLLRRILKSFPLPGGYRDDQSHMRIPLVYAMSGLNKDVVRIRTYLPRGEDDGFTRVKPVAELVRRDKFWFMGQGEVSDPKDLVLSHTNVSWLGLTHDDDDFIGVYVGSPIATFEFPRSVVDQFFSNPDLELQP